MSGNKSRGPGASGNKSARAAVECARCGWAGERPARKLRRPCPRCGRRISIYRAEPPTPAAGPGSPYLDAAGRPLAVEDVEASRYGQAF